jgi:NADH:ubiquinone oxidoreductase subunit 2 (subunit N)
MAGMPPLLGFFGKFFIVVFFFKKSQLFLFILFIFINVFVIYFYIINIRFIITKSNKSYFFIKNYTTYLSFPIICLLLFFFLLNFFGIFFLSDFILFIDALTSFNF